ncbi:MAG: outer membrane beta-barrel protein [Bdellovibrionota bacterium]
MKILILTLILFPVTSFGSLTPEAYLDTYYAHDLNSPRDKKRSFTTQSVRHDEPNINLAFGGVKLEEKSVRGRLAIQGGNSVEANTLTENSDLKYLQEALIGKKLGEKTWLDGGIYLGHIGAESWISRDNWTYTRSLNLDYVPYYATGLRLTHDNFQFHLMNGWQNIREDNKAKAVGLQYVKRFERHTFTYNNFFGDEEVTPGKSGKFSPRFRGYHNFILKWDRPGEWEYLSTIDIGHESQKENEGVNLMWATTFTTRLLLSETQAIASRIEYYNDAHGINIIAPQYRNFEVMSASVNFDQKLGNGVLWRSELKAYTSKDEIFSQGNNDLSRNDGVLITSLSLSLP